jgi:hypothetical protein
MVYFRKSYLQRSSDYFRKNVKTKIFLANLVGKTLLPLLFLSPGARKFLMLTKISQEIQIFAKAFRGISFYSLIFHLIKTAKLCMFLQVISANIEFLFS